MAIARNQDWFGIWIEEVVEAEKEKLANSGGKGEGGH
jgi:hypothetical protein